MPPPSGGGGDGVAVGREGDGGVADGDQESRQDLQSFEQRDRVRPAVRLDEADGKVRPALLAPVGFFEHPVRLADPGRHAQIDT